MNIQYLTHLWAELTRFPKVTLSFRPSWTQLISWSRSVPAADQTCCLLWLQHVIGCLLQAPPTSRSPSGGDGDIICENYTFWLFQQWDIVLHNTKRARKKLNDPLNFDVLFLFNWPARRVREFKAHFIGWVWQQSRVLGTRLAELLGGSQVSQHFGRDKLGVDKSGLPQSKHFATL